MCAVRLQLWLLAWSRALSAGEGLRLAAAAAAALAAPRKAVGQEHLDWKIKAQWATSGPR